MLASIQEQNIIVQSLVYAAILTVGLPIFGWFMSIIIEFCMEFLSGLLGPTLAFFLCNYVTFIGVVHHELAHALVAFLTGAKVVEIKLFQPSQNMLGYVNFIPRGGKIRQSFQLVLTSVAPIFCGTVTLVCLYYYMNTYTFVFWQSCILYYFGISIILHMTMSQPDIQNYRKGLPIVYVIISLLLFTLLHYGII